MVCLAVAVLGFTVSLCFSQGGNPRGLSLAHRSHFLSSQICIFDQRLRPPPESGHESAPTLSYDARALLCTCIERLARTGVAAARLAPGPAAEVRALLSHSRAPQCGQSCLERCRPEGRLPDWQEGSARGSTTSPSRGAGAIRLRCARR